LQWALRGLSGGNSNSNTLKKKTKKKATKNSSKNIPDNNSHVTLAKVARVVRCGSNSSSSAGGDVTAAASWVQENAR